jgi:hypothetical protein
MLHSLTLELYALCVGLVVVEAAMARHAASSDFGAKK